MIFVSSIYIRLCDGFLSNDFNLHKLLTWSIYPIKWFWRQKSTQINLLSKLINLDIKLRLTMRQQSRSRLLFKFGNRKLRILCAKLERKRLLLLQQSRPLTQETQRTLTYSRVSHKEATRLSIWTRPNLRPLKIQKSFIGIPPVLPPSLIGAHTQNDEITVFFSQLLSLKN